MLRLGHEIQRSEPEVQVLILYLAVYILYLEWNLDGNQGVLWKTAHQEISIDMFSSRMQSQSIMQRKFKHFAI